MGCGWRFLAGLWLAALGLLTAAPVRAQDAGGAAGPPSASGEASTAAPASDDPLLAAQVAFLEAEAHRLRAVKKLSATALKEGLLSAYPLPERDGPARRARLQRLLKAAIRVDNLDTRSYQEGQPGDPFFQVPEAIASSPKVYNIDLFNALLDGDRLTPALDFNRKTALMYAAEADRFEVLRTLLLMPGQRPFQPLYNGSNPPYIDWCDNDGYTALMHAAANRSRTAVNYLLNAGAALDTRCRVARFSAAQLAESAGDDAIAAAIERRREEMSAWWWDAGWWKVLVTKHEIIATVLFGLLAWGFYLAVWGVRRTIRLDRVREETQNLADGDKRLRDLPPADRSRLAAAIKREMLRTERFRARQKVVPDLVWEADRQYVAREYHVVRDRVLEHRRESAGNGKAPDG